jgi:hypothetical protein
MVSRMVELADDDDSDQSIRGLRIKKGFMVSKP